MKRYRFDILNNQFLEALENKISIVSIKNIDTIDVFLIDLIDDSLLTSLLKMMVSAENQEAGIIAIK